jgi:hypothetical protein
MFRRLVIGNGVEPGRCTATIVRWFGCPTTLQEAKPKAGSPRRPNVRWRGGPQTGIEAQKSTPSASPVDRSFADPCDYQRAIGHPDENQSGRKQRHERHVGPDGQKCRRDEHNGVLQKRASR